MGALHCLAVTDTGQVGQTGQDGRGGDRTKVGIPNFVSGPREYIMEGE